MPIIINDGAVVNEEQKGTARHFISDPKYFSQDFTGKGGSVGLLNERINPSKITKAMINNNLWWYNGDYVYSDREIKAHASDKSVTTQYTPVLPFPHTMMSNYHKSWYFNSDEAVHIGSCTTDEDIEYRIYVDTQPVSVSFMKQKTVNGTMTTTLVAYLVSFFIVNNDESVFRRFHYYEDQVDTHKVAETFDYCNEDENINISISTSV